MRVSEADMTRIREAADIATVAQDYTRLRERSILVGNCPFHGNSPPNTFFVMREERMWHCVSERCMKGGDVFGLVRDGSRVGFPDAVRLVADRFDVSVEALEPITAEDFESAYKAMRSKWIEAKARVAELEARAEGR